MHEQAESMIVRQRALCDFHRRQSPPTLNGAPIQLGALRKAATAAGTARRRLANQRAMWGECDVAGSLSKVGGKDEVSYISQSVIRPAVAE